MKKINVIAAISICLILTSCFKDEPLNSECDILSGEIGYSSTLFDVAREEADTLFRVTNDKATCYVRNGADTKALAPVFKLTPGATISPANGSTQDFSKGEVIYTVTSEDGKWSKNYEVEFDSIRPAITEFDFENFEVNKVYKKFYEFYDIDATNYIQHEWSSGNEGFLLVSGGCGPEDYPTTVLTEGAHGGKYAAKLVTKDTGALGAWQNARMAAGSLFLGTFDLSMSVTNKWKTTRFGVPFDKKPLSIEGYYQYQPGEKYQDEGGNFHAEMTDSCDIYAVIYENTDAQGNQVVLFGDDVKTSPQVVAIATVDYLPPVSAWTQFKINFEYKKEFNEEKRDNHGYSFTIVFSSSNRGGNFRGALGSTLLIDDVKVNCEKQNN